MNAQDLKNSILQLAIQGKLVEQREEEGAAKELKEEIKDLKNRLIKEKQISKETALSDLTDDEIPFDIPQNWEWVKLGEVVSVKGGKRIPAGRKLSDKDTGYKYIRVADMKNGSVLLDNIKYIPHDIYPKISRYTISKNDIYITVAGTIGQVGLIPETLDNANLTENANKLIVYSNYKEFMYYILSSNFVQYQIKEFTTKVGQPKLAIKRIKELIIPLPPHEEQKRIVAKIEELMPYVDKYDAAYSEVQELNKTFPEDMQKSILQYAVQGKLVEQLEEDGKTKDLYKQIQEEKKKLIKEGMIKKTKQLPEITVDEIPFDIPKSWHWMRLGDIGSWSAGATPSRSNPKYYAGDIAWLKTGDLNDGYINKVPEFISEEALKKTSVRLNPVGTVLMAMYGATIGKLGILNIEATTNQACCACIPYSIIDNKYLFYYLMSQRYFYIKMGAGGAQPNISRGKIINSIIPLPPHEEQKRIVAKIEELLPFTQRLVK